jgi:hypothetical protein
MSNEQAAAITLLEWERLLHLLQQLAEIHTRQPFGELDAQKLAEFDPEHRRTDEPPACWW